MKKVILASVLAAAAMSASMSVQAASSSQVFCSGTAGSGAAATITASTNFVKSVFTPKCSANTHVTGVDGDSYYAVGAGSVKGKTRYAGGSGGGAVVAAGSCSAATGCVASDASTAMVSSYAVTS
jgi:hypothetical protein